MQKVTIAIMAGLALLLGATAPAWAETRDAADCAAYVTNDWCEPTSDENYNCEDIPEADKPVQLVEIGVDPFGLDGSDNNGWGCGDAPVEEPPAEEPPADEPGACAHYADSAAWCDDAVEDYDCPDIDDAHKPIELFDAELDPFHLDRDSDALGCEVGEDDAGSTDDGAPDDGAAGDDAGGSVGGGEALPNTGSGDLGPYWLAALAFLAAGALLMIRRTAAQR
ncbi:LPXTG-motif cell wall anchor domain-containing protein [Jiangella alba]|uniref:LPXTG-motif cell wall anchor domain-containing protein n=2 Tax=Jiangella alba TaxID=561176 RepID=A0A1H5K619_9ACTN|nr:LPXTG-motif cell wall anchor domain-containing protein [Jiangella alba]